MPAALRASGTMAHAFPEPLAVPEAPATESDHGAIDQFELVLHTLGLNADGEEPPLRLSEAAQEPTQTVENIVLEGDEIHQSEARVPDKPLDELDAFTRRLGVAAAEMRADAPRATEPSTADARVSTATADGASTSRPLGRFSARRAQLAQAAQRAAGTGGADAARGAARAAGRDPGAPAVEASQGFGGENPSLVATPDLDIPGLRARPPSQHRLWLAGCGALGLLLLVQLVNHWRDALAASPTWGHPVTGLYAALGVPLQPHWDLSAYEVRQQGAESDGGPRAAIRVRFSLANHAMRAQPVPLLRLTLLDRYGRRVAERDLTPSDYWPMGRSVERFLSADERVDTEVKVLDPSADSASFELDVCLPDSRSIIRCAGDGTAASAGAAAGAAS